MRQQTKILNIVFIVLCCVLIVINALQLIQKLGPARPIGFAGIKFSGLTEQLKDEQYIGYISDLNIKDAAAQAEYAQAQYVLAPVILDIEHPSIHRYVIINCSTDAAAIIQLKELNARPLLRNQFGVILAATAESRITQNHPTNRADL